jgi:hypothetical protein
VPPEKSDIFADYRKWRFIHRLAAEVERLRQVLSQGNTPPP